MPEFSRGSEGGKIAAALAGTAILGGVLAEMGKGTVAQQEYEIQLKRAEAEKAKSKSTDKADTKTGSKFLDEQAARIDKVVEEKFGTKNATTHAIDAAKKFLKK